MEKLLYINNYNCSLNKNIDTTDNHFWAIDRLCAYYDVTCAHIPDDFIKFRFKGSTIINRFLKSFVMLIKYFKFPIVYAACGELTTAFAMANKLHLGRRRLYMIQHHGGGKIWFSLSYTKIIFISSFVSSKYSYLGNSINVCWGGDNSLKIPNGIIEYDFISVGKTLRDHECMIKAANDIDAKTIIVAAVNNTAYDDSKITIISGKNPEQNSLEYDKVYKLYAKSRFIVIPISIRSYKNRFGLTGLTTFIDAVVMNKPVLISDNTNMGIDVMQLGIGLEYKAGNYKDMKNKMEQLISMPEKEYNTMCENMKRYSTTHNYNTFCEEILNIIR